IKAVVDYVTRNEPGVTLAMLGNSMGGALSICYAARDERVRAVVAQSPYASMRHSLSQGVRYFTGLPAFPFVPLMRFFSLPYVDLDAAEISPIAMLARLQDTPVLIMMGGADEVVNPQGAQQLYEAGGESARLWYEPALEHVNFHIDMAPEFERRVVEYLTTALRDTLSN
ncbi:MAG: alpha/beta hydrolase, partial [Geobacteraceae bacterium]|nr:alpha/beta hydrolase [Geobacteraceae bacterium]